MSCDQVEFPCIGNPLADLAFAAGQMLATGKIRVEHPGELMAMIRECAASFEDAYEPSVDGDRYGELIDAYAEFCLRDKPDHAVKLLNTLRASKHKVRPLSLAA